MKKFLLILAGAFVFGGTFAQETSPKTNDKPHKQFVGCVASYWYNSNTEYLMYQLQPKYGYHFNSWFALGITLDYAHTRTDMKDDLVSDLYGVNPFIRLKHPCKEASVAPIILFADLGVNYSKTKNKQYSSGTRLDDGMSMYIGARPGIAYVLSNRFSIAAYFGFIGYRKNNVPATTNNGSGFTLSTNGLALGLNIHFL